MDREQAIREVINQSQTVSISRVELVGQMVKHIKSMHLEHQEIKDLYAAITGRMIWKRCSVCLKTKLEMEGKMMFPGGDLSKMKQFVCKDC